MRYGGLLNSFLDALYPPRCLLCGGDAEGRHPHCCDSCLEGFAPVEWCCERCGRPFESPSVPHLCLQCLTGRPPFRWKRALYHYSDGLAQALGLLKYRRRLALLAPLSEAMERGLDRVSLPPVDTVVPVPMSLGGVLRRGFNQSAVFGELVARRHGLAVSEGALRNRGGPHQVGLGAPERLGNAARLFAAGRDMGRMRGKRVLLVDDVCTTGATVRACARLLRKGGAEVSVLTLAIVSPGQDTDHLFVQKAVARQGP